MMRVVRWTVLALMVLVGPAMMAMSGAGAQEAPSLDCTAEVREDFFGRDPYIFLVVNTEGIAPGTKIPVSLSSDPDRSGRDYVFLGTFRSTGDRSVIEVEIPASLDVSRQWSIWSRYRLDDGTRSERTLCRGVLVINDGTLPDGVQGSTDIRTNAPQCHVLDWDFDNDGVVETRAYTTGIQGNSLNFRSSDRWLAKVDANRRSHEIDASVAEMVVRGGDAPGRYPCERGFTGDAVLPTGERVFVFVDGVVSGPGRDYVIWELGDVLYATDLATGYATMIFDQFVFGFEPILQDCTGRYVALSLGVPPGNGSPGVLIDLQTGEQIDIFNENITRGGFDCEGNSFWIGVNDLNTVLEVPLD